MFDDKNLDSWKTDKKRKVSIILNNFYIIVLKNFNETQRISLININCLRECTAMLL